jgi:hypothetical protein
MVPGEFPSSWRARKMNNERHLVFGALALPLAASLAACGGGGGGGGGGTSQVRPTPEPVPIVTTGKAISQTVDYVFDGSSQRFTLVGEPSAVSTEGSFVQETTDGSLTKLTINTGTETIAFDRAAGDTFTTAGTSSMFVVAENLNGARAALVLSPTGRAALGWNYQSFGVWEPGTETGTGTTGVLSYGTPTPAGAIPASGSASYVGLLGGQYINADGVDHILTANLTANVDFASRSLSLQTAGTSIVSAATSATPAPSLDLAGTASYTAGSDVFSGALNSAGGTLSGTTTGRFYGPNAEELGGVGALKAASGVESLQFAFGAKKQ